MTDDVRDVLLAVCRLQVVNLSPTEVVRECRVLEAFIAEHDGAAADPAVPAPGLGGRLPRSVHSAVEPIEPVPRREG